MYIRFKEIFDHIHRYEFQKFDKFLDFYGLTLDKVEDLRKCFSFEKAKFKNLVECYNDYKYGEKKIFSTYKEVNVILEILKD